MFVDHVHHAALREAIASAHPGSIVVVDAICGAGLSTSFRRFVVDKGGHPPAELPEFNGRLVHLWGSSTVKSATLHLLDSVLGPDRRRFGKTQTQLEGMAIEALNRAEVKVLLVEDVHDSLGSRPTGFEAIAALMIRVIEATGARLVLGGCHVDASEPISVLLRRLPNVSERVGRVLSFLALNVSDPCVRAVFREWATDLPVANHDYFDDNVTYERLYRLSGTLTPPGLLGWLGRLFDRLDRYLDDLSDEADFRTREHRRAFGGDAPRVEVTDELMAQFADQVVREDGRGAYMPDINPFSGRSWATDKAIARAEWEALTGKPLAPKLLVRTNPRPRPFLTYDIMDVLMAPATSRAFAEGERRYAALDGVEFEIRLQSLDLGRYRLLITGPEDLKGRRNGRVFELGCGSNLAQLDLSIDAEVHPLPNRLCHLPGSPFYPPLPASLLDDVARVLNPGPTNLSRSQEAQLRQICRLLAQAAGSDTASIDYRTPLTSLRVNVGGMRIADGALEMLRREVVDAYDPCGWVSNASDVGPIVQDWRTAEMQPLPPAVIASKANKASYITAGIKTVLCSIAEARVSRRASFERREDVPRRAGERL